MNEGKKKLPIFLRLNTTENSPGPHDRVNALSRSPAWTRSIFVLNWATLPILARRPPTYGYFQILERPFVYRKMKIKNKLKQTNILSLFNEGGGGGLFFFFFSFSLFSFFPTWSSMAEVCIEYGLILPHHAKLGSFRLRFGTPENFWVTHFSRVSKPWTIRNNT